MPTPVPISQEVISAIEDLIDLSRLAGFDQGYEAGFCEGLKAALKSIEALILTGAKPSFVDEVREDLGLSDEPTPIKEVMGWVIEEPAPAPKQRKKRLVSVEALTGAKPSFVDEVREDLGLSDEPAPAPKQRKKRLVSVKALGLSTKTQNALANAGVNKVKQLTDMTPAELRKIPRIGAGSVGEIIAVLKKHGRSLKA